MDNNQSEIHPLYRPLWLQFRTPQVEALDLKLQQWIYSGITGGIILGEKRIGKSTAIEMLYNTYKTRHKEEPIFCHRFNAKKADVRTIAGCYRKLFISITHELASRPITEKLIQQILEFFLDRSELNSDKNVMLFVDEFQKLTMDQIEIFAELHDDLRLLGVTLSVFFIGNAKESIKLLRLASQSEYDHIGGRFFTQKYIFQGITSKNELRDCLKSYDTTRWPVDKNCNGPTYTEYFLPEDYHQGWRLEKATDLIWQVFRGHQKKLRLKSWGMKYFVGTINPLLTDYLPRFSVEKLNANMVQRCFDVSGLIPDEIYSDDLK